MNNNIPVYEPYLIGNEKKYVNQCLDSNWISSKGEFINKFEIKLFKNCVSVICQRCQKFIMDNDFRGLLKFWGKTIFNIKADPVAISTYPVKSK